MKDPTRDRRQAQIVSKWKANNGKGTLLACTGFGKTISAIKGALELCQSPNASSQRTVLVVVPNLELQKSWQEQLKDFPNPWKVVTIQTLIRRYTELEPLRVSLLIADEIHRYTAEQFGRLFGIVSYNFIFGLSATIDREDPKFATLLKKAPVIDQVTLSEARQHNWVSSFIIYNLGIELSPEEQKVYKSISKRYNYYFSTFGYDYGLAMGCMQDEETRIQHAKQLNWDPEAVMIHAAQFSRTVHKRKKMLYESPVKLMTAQKIIEHFTDRTFIVFSQSTRMADLLNIRLGDIAAAYHSNMATQIRVGKKVVALAEKNKKNQTRYRDLDSHGLFDYTQIKNRYPNCVRLGTKRLREESIKKIKDRRTKVRSILTGVALDEGLDVPHIDASIVLSGSSKTRQSIQRLGRMIRKSEGKPMSFQVELYLKDTQDEVWLRKRQQETENINWISTIDEIDI